MRRSLELMFLVGATFTLSFTMGFTSPAVTATTATKTTYRKLSTTSSSSILFSAPDVEMEGMVTTSNAPSVDWELDCYSRPVMVDGKKLWDVLLTDATGSFRYCKTLPSNQVNSKELRRVVEQVIEESDTKPQTIRFFRGAMFNMINIALSEVEVVAKPSRCTFELASWLEERHRMVYPKMEGYKASMREGGDRPAFFDVRTPLKLPDALRGEKYAFVGLPVAEFLPGGGVNESNVGVGKLCTVPEGIPADSFVQGIVILTSRANALATWLAGTEVVGMKCDLRKRTMVMETDIDNEYLMARLNDEQREEANIFEEMKDVLGGLHFISVQKDENDDPAGFWLLRDLPTGI